MAQNPPKTKEEFLKIKGVNEQKYKQWGEIFIKAIEKVLVSAEEAETVVSTCSTTTIEKAENSAEFSPGNLFSITAIGIFMAIPPE